MILLTVVDVLGSDHTYSMSLSCIFHLSNQLPSMISGIKLEDRIKVVQMIIHSTLNTDSINNKTNRSNDATENPLVFVFHLDVIGS